MKMSKLRRLTGTLALVARCGRSIPLLNMLDSALLYDILEYPGNFTHSEEEMSCENMVHALTPEEQEIAAQTSHAYWLKSLRNEHLSAETRLRAAKKEARRHLVAEKGNWESAMIRLKETCRFRKVRTKTMMITMGSVFSSFSEQVMYRRRSWIFCVYVLRKMSAPILLTT
jgi:hypothetical protein